MNPAWYAVQVIGGKEKETAQRLNEQQLGVYCPLEVTVFLREQGRKRLLHQPMFPGYLFVHSCDIDRDWTYIMDCPAALGILGGENPAVISDQDIALIQFIAYQHVKIRDLKIVARAPRRNSRKPRKSKRARWRNLDRSAQISSIYAKIGLKRPDAVSGDARLIGGSRHPNRQNSPTMRPELAHG